MTTEDTSNDVLIEDVKLLGGGVLLQQLGGHPALCGQYDSILGQDADCGTSVGDGLKSILDLIKTTFRGEDSCLQIKVSPCLHPSLVAACLLQVKVACANLPGNRIFETFCRGSIHDRVKRICRAEALNGPAVVSIGRNVLVWVGRGVS